MCGDHSIAIRARVCVGREENVCGCERASERACVRACVCMCVCACVCVCECSVSSLLNANTKLHKYTTVQVQCLPMQNNILVHQETELHNLRLPVGFLV